MRNSTIIPKKRRLDCGCYDYAFSKNKCKMHANVDSFNRRMEAETEKVIAGEGLQGLIEDADTIFSKYVRLIAVDENGMGNCFICGSPLHWKEAQCMHYIKRGNLYLRWELKNCKSGCRVCNEVKDGNMVKYAERLEEGEPGITEALYQDSHIVHKPSREELRTIIQDYGAKVKMLERKINSTPI